MTMSRPGMMEYEILKNEYLLASYSKDDNLEMWVNKALAKGATLVGGLCCSTSGSFGSDGGCIEPYFFQAILWPHGKPKEDDAD